jgi:prevent-host-death family protein
MQVNILEAKNRLSELVKCAQAGDEVIIANRGKPVMRLVPIDQDLAGAAPSNSGGALSAWLQSRPARAPVRSHEDIEAAIQDTRDAWD